MRLNIFIFFAFAIFSTKSIADNWQFGLHNDAISEDDGNYTNAMFLNYASQSNALQNWVEYLFPQFPIADFDFAENFHLGQKIWTPSEISIELPQENERPYAGLTYFEYGSHIYNPRVAYRTSIMLGVIGEKSKARSVQTEFHRVIGANKPMGWDYQIEDEMVYQGTIEADQLLIRANSSFSELDWFYSARASAGNFQSEVAIGNTLRFGSDLAANFNNLNLHPYRMTGLILPDNDFGSIFYISAEILYRFNDITIEGDLPDGVPRMHIENVQTKVGTGILVYYDQVGVNFSAIVSSPDFKEDVNSDYLIAALGFIWQF